MSFQPVIAASGYAGWVFLSRTIEAQKQAFAESAPVARATETFRERIAGATTAEALVNDRALLQVALGAYGLDDDLPNRAFIQKVLAEGTLDSDAFANRLTDNRYARMSRDFGFGDLGGLTGLSFFADQIIARYTDRQFERAVGQVDSNLRLALSLDDGLADVLDRSQSQSGQWFTVMGNPPLRAVFEGAFGLPPGFGRLDIDQQLEVFQDRSQAVLGTDSIADIAGDKALQERMIQLFLIRAEANASGSATSGSVALALLRGG